MKLSIEYREVFLSGQTHFNLPMAVAKSFDPGIQLTVLYKKIKKERICQRH